MRERHTPCLLLLLLALLLAPLGAMVPTQVTTMDEMVAGIERGAAMRYQVRGSLFSLLKYKCMLFVILFGKSQMKKLNRKEK